MMKQFYQSRWRIILLTVFWLLAALPPVLAQEDKESGWRAVDAAVAKGLPATALEVLSPLTETALEAEDWDEYALALLRKIDLEKEIQGGKTEEGIRRLQEDLEAAPQPARPLLQTVLAHWYWQYFQQNRWRFMQRTQTDEAPGEDFTTWDVPRFFAEMDRHFNEVLENAERLQGIPVGDYEELLEPGEQPDRYRPTLYDFLVQEALRFYTVAEQAAVESGTDFEFEVQSPMLGTLEDYLEWKLPKTGERDPLLKAARLYQEVLRFHRKDADPSALVDWNIARLEFGHNVVTGEGGERRFREGLRRVIESWPDSEATAKAYADRAESWRRENDLIRAREIALAGKKAFPDSYGARMCGNIVREIERKELSVSAKNIWNEDSSAINVNYRNVTKLFFKAIAYDWEALFSGEKETAGLRPGNDSMVFDKNTGNLVPWHESGDELPIHDLIERPAAMEWEANLAPTRDYQTREEILEAPRRLEPGMYLIVASHDPEFEQDDNYLAWTRIQVSDLALVVRYPFRLEGEPRIIEGVVTRSHSGEPLNGVQVEAWLEGAEENTTVRAVTETGEMGFFKLTLAKELRRWAVRLSYKNQTLIHEGYHRGGDHNPETERLRTYFFTDRAIYRPGQTIQFKGILTRTHQGENRYEIVPNTPTTVKLWDANNQEVERLDLRSNDYGSFSGSFTAPKDRLLGRMRIRNEYGGESVRVEEYKRPKFLVKLESPKDGYRLGDTVTIDGKAMSYTGAPVDGAEVKFRITRVIRMPRWHVFSRARIQWERGATQIARGAVRTGAEGGFEIQFEALPDLAVPEEEDPRFIFNVQAEATDAAGETRAARHALRLGYTALDALMKTEDWQTIDNAVKIQVKTETLDGEPLAAEGSIRIHALQQPEKPARKPVFSRYDEDGRRLDFSDPRQWPLGDPVASLGFDTDENGNGGVQAALPAGIYRAVLKTRDRYNKEVESRLQFTVLNPHVRKLNIRIPNLITVKNDVLEPGDRLTAIWGTGYETGRALVEIEHRNEIVERYWTEPGRTQQRIEHSVTEELRGGFTLHVTQVRENRAYLASKRINVPWTNKELDIRWEHFTSKLKPGQEETWTAVVAGAGAERAGIEMAAALYDASLEAFVKHAWSNGFGAFYQDYSRLRKEWANGADGFRHLGRWDFNLETIRYPYRHYPEFVLGGRAQPLSEMYFGRFAKGEPMMVRQGMPAAQAGTAVGFGGIGGGGGGGFGGGGGAVGDALFESAGMADGANIDLDQVAARSDLGETAFFYPHLTANEEGEVRMTFTMSEALTEWRFLGFAHDRALRAGGLEGSAVTSKDLMVQPNAPRFLRVGDELEFAAKVFNQSKEVQRGKIRLSFRNGMNEAAVNDRVLIEASEKTFEIEPKSSKGFHWRIQAPENLNVLIYTVVAGTESLSDGEEGYLPVLPKKILVTESKPLPIRGKGRKEFTFEKLLNSGDSDTLEHHRLTVRMVSNPAWHAVLALPYLMEYPHPCSEQVFNRLYANLLGRHVANGDPRIRRVFEQWKGTGALDSPLEKNEELKEVLLEETPWLREAKSESEARRHIAVLFDDNRLDREIERALRQLGELQLDNGAWPWFPGGRENPYITLYIATGFGRLKHMGLEPPMASAEKAWRWLDDWLNARHQAILKEDEDPEHSLTPRIALYLYGRSYFLNDLKFDSDHQKAVDYFLDQARQHWLELPRQSQAHAALALHRFGKADAASGIVKSIREHAVEDEQLGMHWRDAEQSWRWHGVPIETQALMIEMFDEIADDAEAVESCRVWLLKQKQTRHWKSTKATADAVYAVLLRGRDLLETGEPAEIKLGETTVQPGRIEAGTGFYEKYFSGPEIKPEWGRISVSQQSEGAAWGAVHWQYFEDLDKITAHNEGALIVEKKLYLKKNTDEGPRLELYKPGETLEVGDTLATRLVVKADRDMEYVHLKDQRGSGLEPVNVLSGYRFLDGLSIYESTRDTAAHFFIDALPKGTYVLEHESRVFHAGVYPSGIANLQCMYAPEFSAHSSGATLSVRPNE